jgi:predicted nuclease with TOPRIM domain
MGQAITYLKLISGMLLLTPFFLSAQTISTQKGLTRIEFPLPQGKISVYLPDDIRPGETVSGTVTAIPAGASEKEKIRNRELLEKYTLHLLDAMSGKEELSRLFRFSTKSSDPSITLTLNNKIISTAPVRMNNMTGRPGIVSLPTHILTAAPARITGPFDGNASNTQCRIDGKVMEILAESPRQCIIKFPEAVSGPHTVSVTENGKITEINVSAVNMNVNAGKLNLQKGEKTYVDVTISGLQNLPSNATLTCVNSTTAVVTMTGGESQVIPIPPAHISGAGSFNKRFELQSTKTGGFSVTVNLDLPEPGSTTSNAAALCNCYLLEQTCLIPLQTCLELGGSPNPPSFTSAKPGLQNTKQENPPVVYLSSPSAFNRQTGQVNFQLSNVNNDVAAVIFSVKPAMGSIWQPAGTASNSGNNWHVSYNPPVGYDGEYIIRARVVGKNNTVAEEYTRMYLQVTPEALKTIKGERISLNITDAQINNANQNVQQIEEKLRRIKERIAELRRRYDELQDQLERKKTMAEELAAIDKVIEKIPGKFSDSLKKLTDSLAKLKAELNGKPDNDALKKAAEEAAQRERDCADRLNALKQEKENAQKELNKLNHEIEDLLDQMDQLHLGNNWVGGHGYHADGSFWYGYVGDENSNTNIDAESKKLSDKLKSLKGPQNAAKKRIKDLDAEIAKAQEECDKLKKEKEKAEEAAKKGDMHAALETQIDELCRQIDALLAALRKWCKEHPGECNFNPALSGSPRTLEEALAYIDLLNDIIKKKQQKETDLKNEAGATASQAEETESQLNGARGEKSKLEDELKKAQAAADKLQSEREKQLEEERAKARKKQEEEEAKKITPSPQPPLSEPINPDDKQLKFFALGMLRGLYTDYLINKGPCDCQTKAIALANNTNTAATDIIGGMAIGVAFAPIENLPGLSFGVKLGIGAAKALASALFGGENFSEELGKNLFNVIGGEIFPKLTGDEFTGNRVNELAGGGLDALLKAEGVRTQSWEGETELRNCGKVKGKTTMLFNPNTGWVTLLIKIDNCPLVVIKYKVNADGVPIGKPTVQKVTG